MAAAFIFPQSRPPRAPAAKWMLGADVISRELAAGSGAGAAEGRQGVASRPSIHLGRLASRCGGPGALNVLACLAYGARLAR